MNYFKIKRLLERWAIKIDEWYFKYTDMCRRRKWVESAESQTS